MREEDVGEAAHVQDLMLIGTFDGWCACESRTARGSG